MIGTSLVQAEAAGVSPTAGAMALIVGLFLSNFPEALSSSVGMLQQGMRFWRVFTMWGAIVLVTGLGAVAGRMLLAGADHDVFAFLEGVAAGAMLTMIAETMLPEAFARGGKWTGLATLMGFLVAILVSSAARGGH